MLDKELNRILPIPLTIFNNNFFEIITMKKIIILTALVSAMSLPALAQSSATDAAVVKVEQDNAKIKHENHEIKQDAKEVSSDKRALTEERKERNLIQAKEDKAVKTGDTEKAANLEQRREHEQKEVNEDRKELNTDKAELHKDKAKRSRTKQKRNKDAAKIQ